MRNRTLSSVILMTENRTGYKPRKYIESYVKDKDKLTAYEAIAPEFSTSVDLKKLKIRNTYVRILE